MGVKDETKAKKPKRNWGCCEWYAILLGLVGMRGRP